jgi:drug/metabolite transporter (DMT)-like permease
MNWFFIALVAPALWAVSNHIDKFLLSKYFKTQGVGPMLIFSSLIGVVIDIVLLPFLLIFHHGMLTQINLSSVLFIMCGGMLFVVANIPYLYAMRQDETSTLVPIFQTIPVFAYFLALIFLKETLTIKQIFASLLIISGAVSISLDFKGNRLKIKKIILSLMLLSSFLFAVSSFIFKVVAIEGNFLTTIFWENIGFTLITIIFFFVKSYRDQFWIIFKENKAKIIGVNALNETINIIAKLIVNFATLLAPLALVWVANGFQPLFVFVFGILMTVFWPKLGIENVSKQRITQKLISILIMFIGVYFLGAV